MHELALVLSTMNEPKSYRPQPPPVDVKRVEKKLTKKELREMRRYTKAVAEGKTTGRMVQTKWGWIAEVKN